MNKLIVSALMLLSLGMVPGQAFAQNILDTPIRLGLSEAQDDAPSARRFGRGELTQEELEQALLARYGDGGRFVSTEWYAWLGVGAGYVDRFDRGRTIDGQGPYYYGTFGAEHFLTSADFDYDGDRQFLVYGGARGGIGLDNWHQPSELGKNHFGWNGTGINGWLGASITFTESHAMDDLLFAEGQDDESYQGLPRWLLNLYLGYGIKRLEGEALRNTYTLDESLHHFLVTGFTFEFYGFFQQTELRLHDFGDTDLYSTRDGWFRKLRFSLDLWYEISADHEDSAQDLGFESETSNQTLLTMLLELEVFRDHHNFEGPLVELALGLRGRFIGAYVYGQPVERLNDEFSMRAGPGVYAEFTFNASWTGKLTFDVTHGVNWNGNGLEDWDWRVGLEFTGAAWGGSITKVLEEANERRRQREN